MAQRRKQPSVPKAIPGRKIVRFLELVQDSGRPEPLSLWVAPEQDSGLQAALKEKRLLSIKSSPASNRKDFGVVGFLRERGVTYLVFPRPLKAAEGSKVVGIRYEETAKPGPHGKPVVVEKSTRRTAKSEDKAQTTPDTPPEPSPRAPKRFAVTVRFTAVIEVTHEFEALSRNAAVAMANKLAPPDFSGGKVLRKVVRVRPA